MTNILREAEKYILLATVFLMPLVFIPLFPNPFDTPKLALLAAGVSLVILIRAIKIYLKGALEYASAPFDLPVFLLLLAYLLAALIKTPNKMEAFFLPGTASLIVLAGLLYLLANTVFGERKEGLLTSAYLSGILLSAVSLFATIGVFSKIPQLPSFLKSTLFALSGGTLPTALYLVLLVPLGAGNVLEEKEVVKKIFWGASLAVIVMALGVSVFSLLPGKPTSLTLPSYQTSWAVAIETLKESPLFGVGPGNYLSAFGRFRPLAYNATPAWNLRFSNATSYALTLFTETGLLGLAAFALLVFAGLKTIEKNLKSRPWATLALALALTATLVLPGSLVFLLAFFVLLSANSEVKEKQVFLAATLVSPAGNRISKFPAIAVALPAALIVLLFWFFSGRALFAEAKFQTALSALNRNEAKATYDNLAEAVRLNPFVDRYHAVFSQVNLVVAGGLAQNKDIKEADRQNIAGLIQQAIAEAKASVALNPQRAGNWASLAGTYTQVLAFAQGADQFAIQTYNQAVALDPIDPSLRISLGGVYYALGRYDDAIDTFKLATFAKPDLANAHYNLSAAYREKGETDKAINEMKTVLALVDKSSLDYTTAKEELINLESRKVPSATKATEGKAENLTPPQPAPAPAIKPPLELPSEATPPASP